MLLGLQILMIWRGKKNNVNSIIQKANNNALSQTKYWSI